MRLKSWTPLEIIETILAINLLVWGTVFLFPGNVFDTPIIQNRAIYAQDWFWGGFLVLVALSFFVSPLENKFWLRRLLHTFCWVFWSAMTVLLMTRVFSNGIQPTDFLFVSLFVALALCHLTLHSRLVGVK